MNREELVDAVENCFEELYSNADDEAVFTVCEVEEIVDELHGNGTIDWRVLADFGDNVVYCIKDVNDDFSYIFNRPQIEDTLTEESVIDLILNINDKYESVKDRVVFNG